MWLGIITLFPKMFRVVFDCGVVSKSLRNGSLSVTLWNPRSFTYDSHQHVDDHLYGGGPGMLMLAQPLQDAIHRAKNVLGNDTKVIYLSPRGKKINQTFINKLVRDNKRLILICGRYQGIDERVIQMDVDEEWSIGDYILSGGELAAMVLIDVISRLLPGVLGNNASKTFNSFSKNKLDCPHYTRPKVFLGIPVPQDLLSGNHRNINRWRLKQSLGYTWMKRPDLLNNVPLTKEEKILLDEFKHEYFLLLKRKF